MTKVTFYQKNGVVIGFDAWDHAGYANAGEDIICAAKEAHSWEFIERLPK